MTTVKRTPRDAVAGALASVFTDESMRQRWAESVLRQLDAEGFVIQDKGGSFTRDEVEAAWNNGADLVTNDPDIYLSGRDSDLVNLVCNAIGTCLDHPETDDLATVILSCYDPETDLAEDEEENAKLSDDDIRTACVETVKGWINQ